MSDLYERIHSRLDIVPNGCWLWMGATVLAPRGGARYGVVGLNGRTLLVHRVMYGDIPQGMEIDHLCRVTLCCNPEHLEAVSHRENVLRGKSPAAQQARQLVCKRGHDLSVARIDVNGARQCRVCDNMRAKAYYQRRKNAHQACEAEG